jgi:hypothetical protein
MAIKRSTGAILLVVGIFAILVALNFIFFVDRDQLEETEFNANRSSYKTTPYGTHAFYTLLEESGYEVTRYERPLSDLSLRSNIGTLFVVSPPEIPGLTEDDFQSLKKWTEAGGLLILVDREIDIDWSPDLRAKTSPGGPADVRSIQPTIYTRNVNRVALSKLSYRLELNSKSTTYHLGDSSGGVLADARLGRGRVLMLTEPYVIANNGIAEADNLFLAINLLADRPPGSIAFDEFHHGYGSSGLLDQTSGGVISYFRGTPIPWMMAQGLLIVTLAIYARGRRFGRPLPVKREARTTNLEFVSSMANIARLARASDLAMQNIYSEFRRKLCRYVSLPTRVETPRLAAAVARRGRLEESHLRRLLMKCEMVSRGQQVSDSELLGLVTRVREVEAILKT